MAVSRRPTPALSAVLSAFVWPGLGQLYNGRLAKFAAVQFGLLVGYPAALLAVLRVAPTRTVLLGLHVAVALGWVAVAVEAYRDARRMGSMQVPPYARGYVLAAVGVVAPCVVTPVATVVVMKTLTPVYKIPAGSMEPTILSGDHFFANAAAYGYRLPLQVVPTFALRPPTRGDLAVFRYPPNPSQHFVKRVVGLPGETVEVRGRTVFVDGQPLDEPYAVHFPEMDGERADWGPETVPAGQYWMLGDNRDYSRDSRYWGFLPQGELIARVGMIYVSIEPARSESARGPEGGRIRWDRFGLVPR